MQLTSAGLLCLLFAATLTLFIDFEAQRASAGTSQSMAIIEFGQGKP